MTSILYAEANVYPIISYYYNLIEKKLGLNSRVGTISGIVGMVLGGIGGGILGGVLGAVAGPGGIAAGILGGATAGTSVGGSVGKFFGGLIYRSGKWILDDTGSPSGATPTFLVPMDF